MSVNLSGLGDALSQYILLGSFPVAVSMVKEGDPLPERVKLPWQQMNIKIATCQAIAMARRYGWVVALGEEDISCPLTAVVFGFRRTAEFYLKGKACAGMYTETEEAGIHSEAVVEKYNFGEYKYILMAPLHRAAFEPAVVIIYANPAQILRLLTAALWKSGGKLTSSFGGRIDCAEEIIVPQRSGKCEVILPCYGDRIFAQTQDHEMAFSIPIGRVEELVEGLAGTQKGGVRYPMPSFLRYTGEFPEQYTRVAK